MAWVISIVWFYFLGFLYPYQSSWQSWSHVSLWLLLLLPAWSRVGPHPVVRNSQQTQGNFQLRVALVSCILCVIAVLIAHYNDDFCARSKGREICMEQSRDYDQSVSSYFLA